MKKFQKDSKKSLNNKKVIIKSKRIKKRLGYYKNFDDLNCFEKKIVMMTYKVFKKMREIYYGKSLLKSNKNYRPRHKSKKMITFN